MDEPAATTGALEADRGVADLTSVVDSVRHCAERVRLTFDRWGDPHAHGPGLYFLIEDRATAGFVQPMGRNRWPVEECADTVSDPDALVGAATSVALTCDGAVVVHPDGTIREKMVRIEQLSAVARERVGDLPYAEWMGTRHMSGLETSTRPEVFAVVTLSEEDGRVTVFRNGTFEDSHAHAAGGE